MRERNIGFHAWLNKEEKARLERNAKKCGLSQQSYFRCLLKEITPKEQPAFEFFTVLKRLEQINNNMNQIARKANATGNIDAAEYEANVVSLQDITAELLRTAMSEK